VAADDEDGVFVAADGLGDDVLAGGELVGCLRGEIDIFNLHCDVVEITVNVQSRLDSRTTGDGIDPGSGVGL
jgi:hypothetical protein